VEFVEHREYYPGDEIRHIDWRAFGKTGRYYVKEFEDETNLRAWIVTDVSGSMKYAGRHLSKFQYARVLAASLSWLLLSQRDAVGLVTFDSAIRQQLKPSSSREAFRHITGILESTQPGDDTSLANVLQDVLTVIPRRSLLILISDCFDDVDPLCRALQRCCHDRHETVIFRIVAPDEEEFPFERPTQFRDLEVTGNRLLVDPARLRREYLRQYREFDERLSRECGALGISQKKIRTSEPLQAALGEWLAGRMEAKTGRF
jgi:uncharacterized protein (DUF58 family)